MQHIFWLIENELCGRPGPNHQPWQAAELRQAGIGALLSVNHAESVYADEFEAVGIEHRCIPLASNAPPREGDLELCLQRLPEAYDWVRGHVDRGRVVLVHCRHGKDRTGLFMAYYLKTRSKLSTEAAIAEIMRVRPIALTAMDWDRFAVDVLNACD